MKISENIEKNTLPGKKMVWRFFDEEGHIFRDGILLDDEIPGKCEWLYHPTQPDKKTQVCKLQKEQLLQPVFENGVVLQSMPSPLECHQYLLQRAGLLPEEHKRFIMPHIFKVGISAQLLNLRNDLVSSYARRYE
jgi:nicotinate phosphoribosyltransferase